jgi:hypothetical protein
MDGDISQLQIFSLSPQPFSWRSELKNFATMHAACRPRNNLQYIFQLPASLRGVQRRSNLMKSQWCSCVKAEAIASLRSQ